MSKSTYTYSELSNLVDLKIKRIKSDVDSRYSDDCMQAGYAYATGYLQSLCAGMLADLPKSKQEFYIKQLMGA